MTSEPSPCAPEAQGHAYLIAGAGGMLGTALQRVMRERGLRFEAPVERELDITDPVAVRARVSAFAASLAPAEHGVLINAAAYTSVEAAEDNEDAAYLINAQGPAILARAAHERGLGFVHVSTNFVFDGRKVGAYTEDDDTNPLSVYGTSRLSGELAVELEYPGAVIVRTAWAFGPGGVNFPVEILEAARTHPQLSVVTDEVGSPTYSVDLATGILGLVDAGARGLCHLAGAGSCSRFELAERVVAFAGLDTPLEPVTSDAYPTKAQRPRNSMLDCSRAAELGVTMPEWSDALTRFMREMAAPRQSFGGR